MPDALLYGLPALLVVVVIALTFRRSGTRQVLYRLPQPWTHGPVLWAATDEVIPVDRNDHGHGHGDSDGGDDRAFTVGGGASGRW